MLKKILIFACTILLLFVAGCQTDNNTTTTGSVYVGGETGITAELVQSGAVTDGIETFWVGESFPIEVVFKNKGEYTVEEGELTATLRGLDTEMYGISSTELTNSIAIEKVSSINARGGEIALAFEDGQIDSMIAQSTEPSIIIDYEYAYKTKISIPDVCFKSDRREDKLCDLEAIKTVYSSGAPVVATAATQKLYSSNRIAVTFDIENKGNGIITTPDGEFNTNKQRLNFDVVEGDETVGFTCTSYGSEEFARVNNGMTSIICISDELPEDALYTKQLTLELSYKYRDDISKTIRIKNDSE